MDILSICMLLLFLLGCQISAKHQETIMIVTDAMYMNLAVSPTHHLNASSTTPEPRQHKVLTFKKKINTHYFPISNYSSISSKNKSVNDLFTDAFKNNFSIILMEMWCTYHKSFFAGKIGIMIKSDSPHYCDMYSTCVL